jgi:hypothetical protein
MMAKFTGKTEGLDSKKLAALRKVLKEAGIKGDIRINSGRRSVDKAYELYQLDLKKRFPKLKSSMEKLPESSRKAMRERMLRGEYKGKGKPVKNLYPSGKWDRPGLIKQLTKDGLRAVEAQRIANQIAEFRDQNAGLGSSHIQGRKVDINKSVIDKPGVKKLLVDKGYKILDEESKGIWDIAFPKPGVKGSYRRSKRGKQKPKRKSASKADMSNRFLIPENESLIPQWMKKHGYRHEDMMRPEGGYYHPGDAMEPVDPKFEDVEEFEEFKMDEVLKSPQPDFILPDAPPPNPYGVYAQGEPEFEMAEEQEKEKVMMAQQGGEVDERRFIASLPLEQRKELAVREQMRLGKQRQLAGLKKQREARPWYANLARDVQGKEDYQAARIEPQEVEAIEKKYGVWDTYAEGGEVYEDSWMEEEVSEAVPRYLQRPEEGQQEEDFKLSGIDDLVENLDETSAKAAEPELQKADEIIKEDVEVKVDAGPELEREQLRIESMSDQELRDYPATAAGRPTAVNEEIRRRKSEIKEQAGIERSPTLDEMVEVEKKDVRVDEGIEEFIKGPKVPKGDVSKREPEVRVVSESEKRREALDRQKAELDVKIEEFQNKESKYDAIDNQRFFNKGGTLNKIISMVAAGFGGYASGRYGGPNVYLDLIDKEVKSDIQQQKLDREDEVAKQNAAYKKIKQLADRYKMSVDNDFAQKKLDMLSKKMDQKIAVNRNKLAVNALKQQDYSRITKPLSRADFTALDFKYPKMKLRERSLVGRDGQVYIVDSVDAKKKLEEQIENNTGAVQAIDQLINLTPKLNFWQRLPGAGKISVNRKVADATRDALVGKLRLELFGPGVMTDTEREQAKKIIGDPGALLEMDDTKLAALQNIRWKLKYAERERLRRNGVQVPMSRNDLKVDNRLKNLGYPPFAKASPQQRRIAMDILINAEKAAMRKAKAGKPPKGYYKGKFWDKDEQGNF